ncbi:MAG: response regulator transcription factor [SAR202 cluster bacterium]|nr:response regulator transcription factor [SAR202 cluster bacterium]
MTRTPDDILKTRQKRDAWLQELAPDLQARIGFADLYTNSSDAASAWGIRLYLTPGSRDVQFPDAPAGMLPILCDGTTVPAFEPRPAPLPKLLLVEDRARDREHLEQLFKFHFRVLLAQGPNFVEAANELWDENRDCRVAVIDLELRSNLSSAGPGNQPDGLQLLYKVSRDARRGKAIVLTGHPDDPDAEAVVREYGGVVLDKMTVEHHTLLQHAIEFAFAPATAEPEQQGSPERPRRVQPETVSVAAPTRR